MGEVYLAINNNSHKIAALIARASYLLLIISGADASC